ncbi:zinc finger BED domain-containing protein RICESLEEPER 1-like [Cornus florida]|uniref:zinc finger BED domain-containing protein RICESLEEPER 1-like n=1 Tax=Cornus florida TaxID=4283 RepID=UPI0028A168E8|nr:zinc finger BED domain-containing protein RICESLEEPER 1-like [Cornus florida]
MLQTALPSKDVFLRLKHSEKLYTCVPSEEEWGLAQEICDKLKEIHSVIDFCSGTTNTIANHFFPMVCEIRQRLYKWVMDPSKVISKMASDMMEKFEKYWSGCHMMVATAVVLDPRYKMKMVEYYYSLIYGQDAETEIEKVRKFCYDLPHEYEDQDRFKVQRACNSGATSPHRDSMLVGNYEPDFLLEFDLLVKLSSNNGHVKSELDCYLDEKVLPRTPGFDVLGWWKNVGIKYPILQKIARDVMAIPVSTVPSKSVFSTHGKAVSTQRSKLEPKLLEALMCSKDWLMKDMAVTCSTAEPSCASEIDADDEGFNWWE